MKLKRIEQTSRVELAADRIRALIENGSFAPGTRIPSEPELAEKLGVSRPVLREAIGRLKSVGLLDVRHGSGTFVGTGDSLPASVKLLRTALAFSPRDLQTVAEFRRGIEQVAVRSAAVKATPEQIAELKKLCEDMDRYEVNSLESMRIDYQFHQKIVDICGNALMSNVMSVLFEFMVGGMVQTIKPMKIGTRGQGHRPILDAIEMHDPDAAENAMREHMNLLDQRLKEVLSTGVKTS